MQMDRREFLGVAATGTAGVLMADRLAMAAPVGANPTALVPLGKDLRATRIGFGTGMGGWKRQTNQTRLGPEKFLKLLEYAYDQNIRLFDMADLYGTHGYVARALRGKPRQSYTLATKIWLHPDGLPERERPDADACVARFLKELGADYIDLVQLHCMTSPKWPQEMRRQMDLLAELKRKGVIRAHGASIHSFEALAAAAEEPWVDVIHARVNVYQHRTDGPMEKVVPILNKVHAAGKGIIAMKLIGEGKFDARQRQTNLRFVMGLSCIDAMIVGFETVDQIDQFKTGVKDVLTANR
jgi:aryl-alcohol dehydrogenase-like predicted oxidoreductase